MYYAHAVWMQESYSIMVKYQISVAKEETEKVDTMRFAWNKLNTLVVSNCTIQYSTVLILLKA